MGESSITHIHTGDNYLSDHMTKMTHGAKHHKLIGGILYDIYDDHLHSDGKTSLSQPSYLEGSIT